MDRKKFVAGYRHNTPDSHLSRAEQVPQTTPPPTQGGISRTNPSGKMLLVDALRLLDGLAHTIKWLLKNPDLLLSRLQAEKDRLVLPVSEELAYSRLEEIARAFDHERMPRMTEVMNPYLWTDFFAALRPAVKTVIALCRMWDYMSEAVVHAVLTGDQEHLEYAKKQVQLRLKMSTSCSSPFSALDHTTPINTARTSSPSSPEEEETSVDGDPAMQTTICSRSKLNSQARAYLFAWFVTHKRNPYPSQEERQIIATTIGLTERQVRNWFANIRKRHWKPSRNPNKKPRTVLDVVLRKDE